MLKKKLFLVLAIMILAITTGCGTSVKDDLAAYLKFEQTMSTEAAPIIADFNSKIQQMMSNHTNVNKKEEKIKVITEALQKFTALADKEKAYKPKTKEVEAVHQMQVKQADITINVLNKIIKAVQDDKFDQNTISEINKTRQELQKAATDYRNAIAELQAKNK
ncbi:hypothetical protein [Pectinatus brassicae]|uniref:4-hydroxy-L-threonine phosphate dehydrogenase PdxA n=1 Tax=Pectinatus brassicae TaxID=862415 RepID=A0A840ULX4_9FIRM|nr:hypothetical protein [Pectinatus brassicae]MBB5335688.1 4-hydroxy-L-threonine phosphate dehydrogenase PdxA [Pectinatus brassicae]